MGLLTFSYIKLVLIRSKINRAAHFTKIKSFHKNQVFIRRDPTKRFRENNAFNASINKGEKAKLSVINAMGHISGFVSA